MAGLSRRRRRPADDRPFCPFSILLHAEYNRQRAPGGGERFGNWISQDKGAAVQTSGRADLTGQVAILTGAARGIGQACAWALAAEGADVVTADLGPSETTVARVRALG